MLLPQCLTIAGSDPSGGAGIQGDLKTFSALGTHGMAVITALTAQNTRTLRSVFSIPAQVVEGQVSCLMDDIRCDAVKTGMLANREIVEAVAAALRKHPTPPLIIDPVIKASVGGELLDTDGIDRLKKDLLPLAAIVTPNVAEAGILSGIVIRSKADMHDAARTIHSLGPRAVLITGGDYMPECGSVYDLFFDGKDFTEFESSKIRTQHSHGSGCCLTAAICAFLARKLPLCDAVERARTFTRNAIQNGYSIGEGTGPVNPLHSLPQQL